MKLKNLLHCFRKRRPQTNDAEGHRHVQSISGLEAEAIARDKGSARFSRWRSNCKLGKQHKKALYIGLAVFVVGVLVLTSLYFRNRTNITTQKDFSKGVLAVNTNKSVYSTDEKVEIGLGSLDQNGDTLCNSNLQLVITGPKRQKTEFTTSNGTIEKSATCSSDNNVTNDPDYRTQFAPTAEGNYTITLRNLDTGNEIKNTFEVRKDPKYNVSRAGATRINPFKSGRYPMTITVTAKEDFKGQFVEQIPSSYKVIWRGRGIVASTKDVQTITWDIDQKANESKELVYEYQVPQEGPAFYTIGKGRLYANGKTVFEETRLWMILSSLIKNEP